jgi:hypothetical protein
MLWTMRWVHVVGKVAVASATSLATLACCLAPCSGAYAATYRVSACTEAQPKRGPWRQFEGEDESARYLETEEACSKSEVTGPSRELSGLAAADKRELSTNVPAGAAAGWTFTAPSGDTITAVSMWRDLYAGAEGWVPEIVDAQGEVLKGETCKFEHSGCEVDGSSTHTELNTTALTIELLCEPHPDGLEACVNGYSLHNGRVELSNVTVTVVGEQPPPFAELVPTEGNTATNNPASILGTTIFPNPANGTNASEQAKLAAQWIGRNKKGVRTSAYGQNSSVTGRLTTPSGLPIGGAVLNAYETLDDQEARTVALPSVTTNADGDWGLTLPKDSPSGTVRVEYRSHLGDATPAAVATLTLRVRAGIALRIRPRVTSVGRRIFFTGVLHGAPLPPDGKQLVLEASSGGEWIQFDTIDTAAHGRYRASYKFKFPGPVTYKFRAVSPHESDFPFMAGTSNVVTVHER